MSNHTLIKPNGTKVEVNDNSLKHALSLGWQKEEKQKRTRRTKAEIEADNG